jgi:hypothetical protein
MENQQPHDTAPFDWVTLTTRLRPDLHVLLEARKARTGQSLNRLINEAVEAAFIPPNGGTAKIARVRRRLPARSEPARAAAAYLLGYLGRGTEARRLWPWNGQFKVKAGDTEHLIIAAALAADEFDRKENTWGTSASPSGASR